MALRNASGAAAAPASPAFEGMDDTVTVETPAPLPTSADKAQATAVVAQAAATSELVVARNTAVAVVNPLNKAPTVLDLLLDATPTQELEEIGFGAWPRVTIGLDGISLNLETDLGKEIKISLDSWSRMTMIVTGEQDNPEANKLIRSTYDPVTLPNGQGTVEGYIKKLISEGYTKAHSKTYIELYGDLIWSKSGGDVPVSQQKTVQVSLSPQSVSQFGILLQTARKLQSRGMQIGNVITITQEKKVNGAKKWPFAVFTAEIV